MSDTPLHPSNDPLLAQLGSLGVPPAGVPALTGGALLAKAAVAAPVVAGLAGLKLYGLLTVVLLTGFGGGALVTHTLGRGVAPDPAAVATDIEPAEAAHSLNDCPLHGPSAANSAAPASSGSTAAVASRVASGPLGGAAPMPTTSRASALPTRPPPRPSPVPRATPPGAIVASLGGPIPSGCPEEGDDDSWIPEPGRTTGRAPAEPVETTTDPSRDEQPASAERPDEPEEPRTGARSTDGSSEQPLGDAVVQRRGSTSSGVQPATGHLRAGIGGAAFLFPGAAGPELGASLGLALLAPAPPPAAPLLALNLDLGLASREQLALGTFGLDGEVGIALRPPGIARVEIAGHGGLRLLQRAPGEQQEAVVQRPDELPQEVWDGLSEEEQRQRGVFRESEGYLGPEAHPAFGGRLGLVLGDVDGRLAFRASIVGQALVVVAPDRTTVFPVIGGTVGLDITLPAPGSARR